MLIKIPPPTPPLKERMHMGYVLLSNEPKASWCAVKTTVIYHSVLCMDSFCLKAKTETPSKTPCVGYPLALVRRLSRVSSVPKHQPGRVIDTSAFQEKCQNCRAFLRGYESFTSPSAAAYATGEPVAICAIILKALKPASLWRPLTPFQSPKRTCCLLQEREGPVFPLGESSTMSL